MINCIDSIFKKLFYNVHIFHNVPLKKKLIFIFNILQLNEKEINKILLSKITKCQVYTINLKFTLDLI